MSKHNDRIIFFDTTLRDGEQSPGASLNITEKIEIAHQLKNLGIDVIEAGFPISSPGDFEAVKSVARQVRGVQVCGLARAVKKDIDTCWDAVKYSKNARIHTFIATSDIHIKSKFKKTRAEILDIAVDAVRYAKKYTDNIEFSAEDAVRSDRKFLASVIEAVIDAGAQTVNIPDTVGYSIPAEFGELIKFLMERVTNIHRACVSVHCHNDLGLAVPNSLAAIQNGARQVECTINGIGERAGNAALEEIVMALQVRKKMFGLSYGINTREIYRTSRLVSSLTGIPVQPNKAIVGANAFAHEAGIHQDGVLKKRLTYEIMTPASVGVPSSTLVLGKHSGRHAFVKRLKELGVTLAAERIDKLFTEFKILSDKKKNVFDEDILLLVEREMAEIPATYTLQYLHTSSGSGVVPTATIQLKKENRIIQEASCGDGPVDAAYKSIDKITGLNIKLHDYSLRSVSRGKDAQGEVTVRVEHNKFVVTSRGVSTDIIEASVKAYLNGVNKILAMKARTAQKNIRVKL
ncbi:MAG: 2-isopropylmalate synthase [Elusimicrobia bacterium]|nr:2-isopropylmalate synthase [Elusimicrobiota bacterium]MBD3412322.1 2-isopropylmalate synthase [Elusimicrobiota bacterium]